MTLSIEAIHEAAHAVMAVLANVPFEYVTIEPGEVNGVMTMGHLKLTGEGDPDLRAVVVAAAQVEDERRGIKTPLGSYSVDNAAMDSIAGEWGFTDLEVWNWRYKIFSYAEDMLEYPGVTDAVSAVALKLEERRRLSSDEVRALVPDSVWL
jgi:hypothetical protein